MPTPDRDTVMLQGEGWFDVPRSQALWNEVFKAPQSIIKRGSWVDRASVGIPYLYISTAANLYEAEMMSGNRAGAEKVMVTAEAIARAKGLADLFAQQTPAPLPRGDTAPALPLGTDTGRR